jgi:hypothetical protein
LQENSAFHSSIIAAKPNIQVKPNCRVTQIRNVCVASLSKTIHANVKRAEAKQQGRGERQINIAFSISSYHESAEIEIFCIPLLRTKCESHP